MPKTRIPIISSVVITGRLMNRLVRLTRLTSIARPLFSAALLPAWPRTAAPKPARSARPRGVVGRSEADLRIGRESGLAVGHHPIAVLDAGGNDGDAAGRALDGH